jgi:hypothetical protein
MRLSYLLLALLLLSPLSWACNATHSSDNRLMIRIRNDSGFDIDNFWLGAGPNGGSTGDTAFGAIAHGATTSYYTVELRLANYHKTDIVIAGVRYLDTIDPSEYIGKAELPPGWYTFVYTFVDDKPVLTIIEEPLQ